MLSPNELQGGTKKWIKGFYKYMNHRVSQELQGDKRKRITWWQKVIYYRMTSNELQGGTRNLITGWHKMKLHGYKRKYVIGWHQMNYRVAQGNRL